jgi:hypothetical protein
MTSWSAPSERRHDRVRRGVDVASSWRLVACLDHWQPSFVHRWGEERRAEPAVHSMRYLVAGRSVRLGFRLIRRVVHHASGVY